MYVMLSASNSSSQFVNLKPKPTLTNSYIDSLVLAKRRARRDWQSSRAPSSKLRLTEASSKLRKTLHEEEDLRATKYIENLSRDHLWKATKTIKPPVESEEPIRKPCGALASELQALIGRQYYLLIIYPMFLNQIPQKVSFLLQLSKKILDHSDPVEVDLDEFK